MADDVTSCAANTSFGLAAAPGQALAQGMNQGANWAMQKATLDQHQQVLEQNKQQLDMLKKDHLSKTGKAYFDEMHDVSQMDKGDVKNSRIEEIRNRAAQDGIDITDSQIATLSDPAFKIPWAKLHSAMTGVSIKNEEAYNSAMGNFVGTMGRQAAMDLMTKGISGAIALQNSTNRANATDDRQRERLDEMAHQRVIQRLGSNPLLRQKLTQVQNLQNSLKLITDADIKTPEQLYELQQSVRANLGIKGQTGVTERDKSYLDSLGLKSGRLRQFVTGELTNVKDTNAIMKHVKNLAEVEMGNASKQFNNHLGALTAGNEHIYSRRPDLKESLVGAISAYRAEVGLGADGSQANPNDGVKNVPEPEITAARKQKLSNAKGSALAIKDPKAKAAALEELKGRMTPAEQKLMGMQ